jgi:putative ABC transport system permease protein
MAESGLQVGLDINDIVIIPVATAMRIFDLSSLFRVMIEVRAHADLDRAREHVLAVVRERHDEDDVSCFTQDSVVGSLSQILTALTLAVGAIGAISLAVAGLGVMNLMLVSVSERTEEVGLLKAVGATRRQVQALFLTEAVLLTTTGALAGLALGFGLVRGFVALYPAFPAAPPAWAVVSVLVLSLAVGALFGVLPARRATALDPVAALSGR